MGRSVPLLMLLNARPSTPSLDVSATKLDVIAVAISMACCVTVAPPMTTLS